MCVCQFNQESDITDWFYEGLLYEGINKTVNNNKDWLEKENRCYVME